MYSSNDTQKNYKTTKCCSILVVSAKANCDLVGPFANDALSLSSSSYSIRTTATVSAKDSCDLVGQGAHNALSLSK